jgi:hypothetical protein
MEEIIETGKHLSEVNYWRWRFLSCNIILNEVKYKESEVRYSNSAKDIELAKLKLDIFKLTVMARASEKITEAKEEYIKLKNEIEAELGFNLSECLIDDNTFEVKRIIKTDPIKE